MITSICQILQPHDGDYEELLSCRMWSQSLVFSDISEEWAVILYSEDVGNNFLRKCRWIRIGLHGITSRTTVFSKFKFSRYFIRKSQNNVTETGQSSGAEWTEPRRWFAHVSSSSAFIFPFPPKAIYFLDRERDGHFLQICEFSKKSLWVLHIGKYLTAN
jgi:hypothetical protein